MLNDIKNSFIESANLIDNWRNIDKNTLCNLYIENENTLLADSYLSAIILKYWFKIKKFYDISKPAATVEDCYEWLYQSILYALEKRKWKDENNKLYTDPNAPDKVINRQIICRRLTFFQLLYKDVRKLNINILSTDATYSTDDGDDIAFLEPSQEDDHSDNDIASFIQFLFSQKEYLKAFIIDGIINTNCFTIEDGVYTLSHVLLMKNIKNIPDNYIDIFSNLYIIDREEVCKAIKCIKLIDENTLTARIKRDLIYLKHEYNLREVL